MALLGKAAMLLWYDIVPDQIAEHDDWHTRQHFPERVGIPGFLRAQRWVSRSQRPRYFVVYEVADIDVLSSAVYNERLDNPTPWTAKIMPHFRGMVRGFCHVESSHGTVLGATGLAVRYTPKPGKDADLQHRLEHTLAFDLMQRRGLSSIHGLRSGRMPEMTAEQRIRGRDASVDRVLFVTGHSADAMDALAANELSPNVLDSHGAAPGAAITSVSLACLSMAAQPIEPVAEAFATCAGTS
jgi:hypothetical protein